MSSDWSILSLPKVELHLHIEGTLEPQMMWDLAQKHKISLPYDSVQAIQDAYQFSNLQSFLDLYYAGTNVLRDADDFYQLMWAYFLRCKEDNIVHTEIMFDPQSHTHRGVAFATIMQGFNKAIKQAKDELGISAYLIMSFLRHLSEADALNTLEEAKPYYQDITAIGLDSSELGNPPDKFTTVFKKARTAGFKCVAHAGEEGPASYIRDAIKLLNVDRIDHGVRAIDDNDLVTQLAKTNMPLTVCPLSNLKLCVVNDMTEHNILTLLEKGLRVTVNSDDPSYFGGYLNDNFSALKQALNMTDAQAIRLIKNSFTASFLPEAEKEKWLAKIDGLI
ncbi:adenosine deaminase [Marinomonas agarivorans]|nr:adenosine deaminase [Marinomonas agarivorans]